MITAAQLLAHDYPLALGFTGGGEAFYGSCPCSAIEGEDFEVNVHCWRVGCHHDCEHSGIHVTGTLPDDTLRAIALHIRRNNGWADSTDWRVTVNAEEVAP